MIALIPIIFAAACWLLSARRTPWALAWAAVYAVMGGIGEIGTYGVLSEHHTLPGLLAITVAGCVVPAICTAATELIALEDQQIARWRRDHALRKKPLAPPKQWQVTSRSTSQWVKTSSDGYYGTTRQISINNSVQVRLEGEGASILIATINVTDDDYEDQIRAAVVNAEERAATLNALLTA